MDDFLIIHHNKNYLKKCLFLIKEKLNKEYELNINEKKTNIYNIKDGIEFLGYKFSIKNNKIIIKIKNSTKKRFKRKTKYLKILKFNNYIDDNTYKKLLSSYKGLLKYKHCRVLFIRSLKS